MNINECLGVSDYKVDAKLRKLIDEPVNEDLIDKNKYANNSEFVPDSIYKRVLNKATNYQWSFIPYDIKTNEKYIQFIGLLIVPGYGVHTGIGVQKLQKKDDSNALSAAKTYAFKNACKEMGIAPNVGNDDFDEALFENLDEDEIEVEETPKPKKKPAPAKEEKKAPAKKKATAKKEEKKPLPLAERIQEVRNAYELDDDDDFVAFLQIWNENIIDHTDLDKQQWMDFFDDLEANPEEYEDF